MNYLDTSALIKRFVAEKGSPLIQRIIEAGSVATAKIAYAEVYAGLKRKHREGYISTCLLTIAFCSSFSQPGAKPKTCCQTSFDSMQR